MALVVTIVILIILAGISLNAVVGNNGIIKKAKEAKTLYEQRDKEDQDAINKLIGEIENEEYEDDGSYILTLTHNSSTRKYFDSDFMHTTFFIVRQGENKNIYRNYLNLNVAKEIDLTKKTASSWEGFNDGITKGYLCDEYRFSCIGMERRFRK